MFHRGKFIYLFRPTYFNSDYVQINITLVRKYNEIRLRIDYYSSEQEAEFIFRLKLVYKLHYLIVPLL